MSWHEAAAQVEDWNSGWRDEIATQRHADIAPDDPRPSRAELADDRPLGGLTWCGECACSHGERDPWCVA